jgi:hypothetical protein
MQLYMGMGPNCFGSFVQKKSVPNFFLVGRGLHGPVPQAKKMQHIQNISAV